MASCPKCGARIKRKRKSSGLKECRRHGPVENYQIINVMTYIPKHQTTQIHVENKGSD